LTDHIAAPGRAAVSGTDQVTAVATPLTPRATAADAGAPAGSLGDRLWSALHVGEQSPLPPTRGLPVARLVSPADNGSTHYVVTAIDVWGRLADRSPLRTLQWRPGLSVAMSVVHGVVVVIASRRATQQAITRQGHLRLPASVRHLCRLAAGDRLLVVACPDRDLLVVYTMAALDAMVLAYHAHLAREHLNE
jgi:hypothetical protein